MVGLTLVLAALAAAATCAGGCSRIDGNYSLDPRGALHVGLLLADGTNLDVAGRAPIWVEPRLEVSRETITDPATGLTTSTLRIAMGTDAAESASVARTATTVTGAVVGAAVGSAAGPAGGAVGAGAGAALGNGL